MASIHQRLARRTAAGSAAQKDVRRMLRGKRLGIKAARELARLIQEQEQQEALAGVALPEEWAPFGGYAVEVCGGSGDEEGLGAGDDDSEEEGAAVEQQQESMLFSHFSYKKDGEQVYRRSFGSVRDYCEQPFANKANEELWKREEFIDGEFREWGRGKKLRDSHGDDEVGTAEKTRQKNLSWFGAEHSAEAAARAFKGWPEGAEQVRSMMSDVDAPPPASLRRKINRGDQGDELDIHSVYRGSLDRAWTRRRRLNTRSRMSVRLVATIGGSNMQKHEEMFWRGAAVAKLAELLEESGYRVELVGAHQQFVDGHDTSTYSTFIVKDAASPLDLEQVAGVLCNAGFARTWGFRDAYAICEHKLRDTVREPQYEIQRVLGKTRRVPTGKVVVATLLARSFVNGRDAVKENKLDDDGTLTLGVPASIDDKESATEWVRKSLEKLAGNAAEEEQGSAQDD